MKRRYSKSRPPKAACDAYRRLMSDEIYRVGKGTDLEKLPAIDLEPPAIDLTHDTGEESER